MDRATLRSLIRGPIATVPTAFDDQLRLDLGVMADRTEWWIANGLTKGRAIIKVAAAMGEGPDLSDDEWPHLLRTVVQAAKGRVHVVCGLKTKNTLHAIEDARKAQDLGAIGVQVDLPIFHHPTQDDYVRYFSDLSRAIEIGILIYNTWWFGAESIRADTLLRLAAAEQVVAVKWAVPPDQDYDAMRAFAPVFNVIDNSNQPVRCHRNGGHGYISTVIHAYPQHDLEVWDLIEAGRDEAAQAAFDRVNRPIRAFMEKLGRQSGGYRVQKALMQLIGQPVGEPRPPSLPLSPAELAELRTIMLDLDWPNVR
jgi:4-hydroxy-tetrahydrodipicolinate synthase